MSRRSQPEQAAPRVLPGATIGILGGGQLARMLAMEAHKMGYRVAVLDPNPDCPAASLADTQVVGALDDLAAARRLAARADVVTLDTEHVTWRVLQELEADAAVRPGFQVLREVQDRLHQRRFLRELDIPQPPHVELEEGGLLPEQGVGFPCVLKTRTHGYDGRGQARAMQPAELGAAWERLGGVDAVMEAWVDFACEISVLLSRSTNGEVALFPIAENEHRDGILHRTRVPARIAPAVASEAMDVAVTIAHALGHVGTMAVELFVTRDDRLLVNEIAPRTHNSGHYSFGACSTSQFEQHVRAICGLPLGDTGLLAPAVMLNLLGDLWANGQPDWTPVLAEPGAQLHLYGKSEPRAGRKMGHVLIMSDQAPDAFADRVSQGLTRGHADAPARVTM